MKQMSRLFITILLVVLTCNAFASDKGAVESFSSPPENGSLRAIKKWANGGHDIWSILRRSMTQRESYRYLARRGIKLEEEHIFTMGSRRVAEKLTRLATLGSLPLGAVASLAALMQHEPVLFAVWIPALMFEVFNFFFERSFERDQRRLEESARNLFVDHHIVDKWDSVMWLQSGRLPFALMARALGRKHAGQVLGMINEAIGEELYATTVRGRNRMTIELRQVESKVPRYIYQVDFGKLSWLTTFRRPKALWRAEFDGQEWSQWQSIELKAKNDRDGMQGRRWRLMRRGDRQDDVAGGGFEEGGERLRVKEKR